MRKREPPGYRVPSGSSTGLPGLPFGAVGFADAAVSFGHLTPHQKIDGVYRNPEPRKTISISNSRRRFSR